MDLVAFSQGPGIGAPLSVGVAAAKYLALRQGKPLIGVNHCYAHVKISEHLCRMTFPLVLYLSGGNSQLIVEEGGRYHVLGETLDIGIGNLFDSFGRAIKMEHAHGSALSKLAEGGRVYPAPLHRERHEPRLLRAPDRCREGGAQAHPQRTSRTRSWRPPSP